MGFDKYDILSWFYQDSVEHHRYLITTLADFFAWIYGARLFSDFIVGTYEAICKLPMDITQLSADMMYADILLTLFIVVSIGTSILHWCRCRRK